MFIETLPGMVQSRILSFLYLESKRFNRKESSKLARNLLVKVKSLIFGSREQHGICLIQCLKQMLMSGLLVLVWTLPLW